MKNRFILFLLAFAGLTGCVEPEIEMFGSISGVVKDSQTNKVLEGVKVTMSPGGNSQLTGQDGTFSFEELDQSEYTLSFVKEGYEDESQKVSVKPGLSASVQVSMMPIVPELDLSTTALSFGEELSTLSIDISNSGKGELKWKVTEDIDWLEASVSEGVTTTEKASVVFKVSRAELEEGNYMDSFVISSNGGSETVMVMLTVATLQFSVTPAEVDFSTVTNTVQLTLTNLGKKSLEWSAKTSKEWLTLSKTSGMITGEDYVNAIASREGLSAGHYTADIIFVSDGGEISVPVLMEVAVDEKPTVTVESISGVSYNGAVLHGTMVSVGSDKVTRHGFCWSSTNETPTIDDEFSNLGDCTTPEAFESVISNLSTDTKYYVRAYAENSVGISYSEKVQTFTTTGLPTLPGVTTGTIDEITSSSAKAKGKITSLGNVTSVSAYGHVWSTEPEPTLENSKSTNLGEAKSAESFVSNLTGLDVATNYYVRAYATNEKGTSYGEIATFVTLKTEAVIETSDVVDIVHNAATAGGKVTSSGGHKINERGVCWSVDPMPNMEDNSMRSESTDDTWTCRLTGLEMENTYYVRAYVKTSDGTVFYGTDKKFTTTKEVKLATLTEVTVSNITTTSAILVATIESDGNSEVTECGFCWSDIAEPSISDMKVNCDPESYELGKNITSLTEGTTYFVKAFAKNAMGIAYSEMLTFTTSAITKPMLSEVVVNNVGKTTAYVSSAVVDKGNTELTEYGFCWSTGPSPTIYDNIYTVYDVNQRKTAVVPPSDIIEFNSKLTDLPGQTTIYVRSYAKNEKGTSYSNDAMFTTTDVDVDIWDGSVASKFGGGSGTESDPIIINEAAQLALLSQKVNEGTTYANVHFCLTSNIGLNGIEWSPIGNENNVFSGTFDGNNNTISEIVITGYQSYVGLFGNVDGTIINTITKGSISGIDYVGGVSGKSESATIINCVNNCTLQGNLYVGGISGYKGDIYKCKNKGTVKGSSYVAGISGIVEQITTSMNSGDIHGDGIVGGIGGYWAECSTENKIFTLNDNANYGDVYSNDTAGGIIGRIEITAKSGTTSKFDMHRTVYGKVINSANYANIEAVCAGGICGYAKGIGTFIKWTYGRDNFIGIVSFENCINNSNIISSNTAGAILGYAESHEHSSYLYAGQFVVKNTFWLNDIASLIGIEHVYGDTNRTEEHSVENSGWYSHNTSQCMFNDTDVVDLLNQWVINNSNADITYKKWKYETVDGYACPVFDE